MSRRAAFHSADLKRAIKACLDAGLKEGAFTVEVEGGKVRVLTNPSGAPLPSGQDDAWAGAMAKWRRSA